MNIPKRACRSQWMRASYSAGVSGVGVRGNRIGGMQARGGKQSREGEGKKMSGIHGLEGFAITERVRGLNRGLSSVLQS